ncbi:lipase family alpha/beta hydrolase [Loktanella sp. Alg231-35]|uniref:lipase family alpha/beta hydrolase n=1 Tax=Loktanella sp. Alg231-35 TaxID=1922220 RepID=UPI000D5518EC|nr:alpha/beta fold hydrolase [Loktanella sp. Alg231-35]
MTTATLTWASRPSLAPNPVQWVKSVIAQLGADRSAQTAPCPAIANQHTDRGKVLILPGMMGSRLSVMNGDTLEAAWLHPAEIAAGGIARLKWPNPVTATGALAASYGQLLARLRMAGFDADFLPYDWRQSPDMIGDQLIADLRDQDLNGVTLVCHSMGGLVARQMAAADPDGKIIARVITIGTPNRGSYAPLQMFDLSHPTLATLARIDTVHDRRALVQNYLRDFPGLLAMLPSSDGMDAEDHFDASDWPADTVRPSAALLDDAKSSVAALPAPDARFHQIIGTGQSTIVGAKAGDSRFQFKRSENGDGVVARSSAEHGDLPRYFVRCAHGMLCNNRTVIATTVDLIRKGRPVSRAAKATTRTAIFNKLRHARPDFA